MPALTHQRVENVAEIKKLALAIYDGKTEDEKRQMFENYVNHIAVNYTITEQREWLEILAKNAGK
jgi:ATP-dependent helicase YprA (DUF1998 family)